MSRVILISKLKIQKQSTTGQVSKCGFEVSIGCCRSNQTDDSGTKKTSVRSVSKQSIDERTEHSIEKSLKLIKIEFLMNQIYFKQSLVVTKHRDIDEI